MPLSITYSPEKDILYGVIEGQVTLEQLTQAMQKITSAKEYPSGVTTLWDLRAFDFATINKSFLEEMMVLRQKNPERGSAKIALLVSDDLGFGMSRMYELMSDHLPQHIMVFRNLTEAENWLTAG